MITFDDTNRLLYVSLKHQDSFANSKTESIEVDEGIFIEKTENGEIVGIQILDGSKSEYMVGAMKDFIDIPKKSKKKLDTNI
tara:strand:- start:39 stop:284 length:246 start_codon:yes stop_codon:yes gene_type:complete